RVERQRLAQRGERAPQPALAEDAEAEQLERLEAPERAVVGQLGATQLLCDPAGRALHAARPLAEPLERAHEQRAVLLDLALEPFEVEPVGGIGLEPLEEPERHLRA